MGIKIMQQENHAKNVCVVSVPYGANCGSFLQAYAVSEFLKNQGYKAVLYRPVTKKEFKSKFYDAEFFVRSLLKFPIVGVKRYFLQRDNYKKFVSAYDSYLTVSDKSPELYEKVVLGSDEIWNVKNNFLDLKYYGGGIKNAITFSVSAGNSTFEDIAAYPKIIEAIKNISFITVRDENTRFIVQKITGKTPPITLDPTFLIDKKLYETELNKKLRNKKYLLVYAYSLTKEEKRFIKRYAKENKLKIVAIGFFWLGANYNFAINPMELYTIAKNAEKIYTNTFHGTVFSILAEKAFISAPEYAKNKIISMINNFGLSDRLLTGVLTYEKFASLMNTPVNYSLINEKIKKIAEESEMTMERALNDEYLR